MKVFWKEWRQQRWVLLFGCLAGMILPLADILESMRRQIKVQTNCGGGVVLGCGAFFAMLLALATTSGEMRGKLADFWQSRPVSPVRLFAVKMGVGALVLLVCFLLILSLDFITYYTSHEISIRFDIFAWAAFCYTYPIALMLFAVTMFYMVVLRDSAKAILLGIWSGLLVYFLPLLVSGLNWMNVFEQVDNNRQHSIVALLISPSWKGWGGGEPLSFIMRLWGMGEIMDQLHLWPIFWSYISFLVFMIGATIGFTALSIAAVKRRWHWQPGQKTIVWAIGLSGACIYGLSLLQLGHNIREVTEYQGREIFPEINLTVSAQNSHNQTGGEMSNVVYISADGTEDKKYFEKNIAFRVGAYPENKKEVGDWWNTPKPYHFILQIYSFPYQDETAGRQEAGYDAISETRFSATPPITANQKLIVMGCEKKGNYLYIAYCPPLVTGSIIEKINDAEPCHLLVADVSDLTKPVLVRDEEIGLSEARGGNVIRKGEYLYINDGKQLMILSLAQADRPEIIKRIDISAISKGVGNWNPYEKAVVTGDQLFYSGLFKVAVFSIHDPTDPRIIYYESFQGREWAAFYQDGYLYFSTREGVSVNRLVPGENGKLHREEVGSRTATPLERLAGRRPRELLVYKGRLVENAGSFGVLVYDISDPARPRRAYHAEAGNHCSDIGVWNGLLWMESYGNRLRFLAVPEKGPRGPFTDAGLE